MAAGEGSTIFQVVRLLLAIFIPFLGVFFETGDLWETLLTLVLCIIFYIPGTLYSIGVHYFNLRFACAKKQISPPVYDTLKTTL